MNSFNEGYILGSLISGLIVAFTITLLFEVTTEPVEKISIIQCYKQSTNEDTVSILHRIECPVEGK